MGGALRERRRRSAMDLVMQERFASSSSFAFAFTWFGPSRLSLEHGRSC